MDFKTLLSVLLVYRSNFHVLHWMCKGEAFFTIHAKASEYADMVLGDVDVIAEMILRHEDNIVNYKDALDIVENCEEHFVMVPSDKLVDINEFSKYSQKMFSDIMRCIERLLEAEEIKQPSNVGIKATLEGMHDRYDLQCRYLLRRFED